MPTISYIFFTNEWPQPTYRHDDSGERRAEVVFGNLDHRPTSQSDVKNIKCCRELRNTSPAGERSNSFSTGSHKIMHTSNRIRVAGLSRNRSTWDQFGTTRTPINIICDFLRNISSWSTANYKKDKSNEHRCSAKTVKTQLGFHFWSITLTSSFFRSSTYDPQHSVAIVLSMRCV